MQIMWLSRRRTAYRLVGETKNFYFLRVDIALSANACYAMLAVVRSKSPHNLHYVVKRKGEADEEAIAKSGFYAD